jgi:hypothetical protein
MKNEESTPRRGGLTHGSAVGFHGFKKIAQRGTF